MTSTSEVMKYEKRGSTAWLTMNRPHAMNAFNTELRNGLVEAIERATADPDILSIVLTGEGGRAFSAGADLKEVARRDVKKDAPPSPRAATSFFTTVADCPKPIIAAIDGHCIAAGLEVALLCDIRVATEQSTFGLPEARRSLMPDPGLIELVRVIPLGEAMKILLTARPITAQRAYDVGLIQSVVPDRPAVMAEAAKRSRRTSPSAPRWPSRRTSRSPRRAAPCRRNKPRSSARAIGTPRQNRGPRRGPPRLRRKTPPGLEAPIALPSCRGDSRIALLCDRAHG